MTHLQVLGVTKTFGAFEPLDGVSLSAAKGEIRALLGENGAARPR